MYVNTNQRPRDWGEVLLMRGTGYGSFPSSNRDDGELSDVEKQEELAQWRTGPRMTRHGTQSSHTCLLSPLVLGLDHGLVINQ